MLIYEEQNWPTFSWDAFCLECVLSRAVFHVEGNMTSSKWAKIGKCSQDTATRELAELVSCGALQRVGQGRSTHYVLGTV